MSTVTLYPTRYGSEGALHLYDESKAAIERGEDVRTTQMCMLNNGHIKDYDKIIIVFGEGDIAEIVNMHDKYKTYMCDRTERELRYAHNFYHLWENGVFDK